MEFKIGADHGANFKLLTSILSNLGKPVDPDWSYQPYSVAVRLASGQTQGNGFPIAKWRWNQMSDANREVLRALCPGLSSTVYIRTPTNETTAGVKTWQDFKCIMNWTPEDEDKQVGRVLGLIIIFTHLEAV